MFHAELDAPTHTHTHATHPTSTDPSEYSTFLESRPQQWEISALQLVLRIARSYPDLRFHIVHLSASDAVPLLQSALLGNGDTSPLKNLTVETCFHYLCLQDTDIPPNATQFKCCPPIRDESNRLKLIDALLDGTIQYVVSDHSPCVPELKKGDFTSAWGGVSGLGLGLSLLWTELGVGVGGRGRGRVELGQIVEWMGGVQAKQVGLQGKKGVLQKGAVADFVVFDPHATFEVTAVCHPSPSPSPSHLHLFFRNKRALTRRIFTGDITVQEQSISIHRQNPHRRCRKNVPRRQVGLGPWQGEQRDPWEVCLGVMYIYVYVYVYVCIGWRQICHVGGVSRR